MYMYIHYICIYMYIHTDWFDRHAELRVLEICYKTNIGPPSVSYIRFDWSPYRI